MADVERLLFAENLIFLAESANLFLKLVLSYPFVLWFFLVVQQNVFLKVLRCDSIVSYQQQNVFFSQDLNSCICYLRDALWKDHSTVGNWGERSVCGNDSSASEMIFWIGFLNQICAGQLLTLALCLLRAVSIVGMKCFLSLLTETFLVFTSESCNFTIRELLKLQDSCCDKVLKRPAT